MIQITSNFDGGNIDCVDCDDPANIRLRLLPDQNTDILQWFYFRVSGGDGIPCRMRILNAGAASYPKGWKGYRAVASYDRENWFRIKTDYANDCLNLRITPEYNSIYIAFFAPYSQERHAT